MKITKVTKTEFELEDGRIFEHPIELDKDITIEEFQKIYDECKEKITLILGEKE